MTSVLASPTADRPARPRTGEGPRRRTRVLALPEVRWAAAATILFLLALPLQTAGASTRVHTDPSPANRWRGSAVSAHWCALRRGALGHPTPAASTTPPPARSTGPAPRRRCGHAAHGHGVITRPRAGAPEPSRWSPAVLPVPTPPGVGPALSSPGDHTAAWRPSARHRAVSTGFSTVPLPWNRRRPASRTSAWSSAGRGAPGSVIRRVVKGRPRRGAGLGGWPLVRRDVRTDVRVARWRTLLPRAAAVPDAWGVPARTGRHRPTGSPSAPSFRTRSVMWPPWCRGVLSRRRAAS